MGILLPQSLWLVDFGSHLLGIHNVGLTGYMFDPALSLFTRGLSLFHGWLPLLLVCLPARLGYDRRALPAWTGLAAVLMFVCYFFYSPRRHRFGQLQHPNQPQLSVRVQRSAAANLDQPKSIRHDVVWCTVARRLSSHPPGLAENLLFWLRRILRDVNGAPEGGQAGTSLRDNP